MTDDEEDEGAFVPPESDEPVEGPSSLPGSSDEAADASGDEEAPEADDSEAFELLSSEERNRRRLEERRRERRRERVANYDASTNAFEQDGPHETPKSERLTGDSTDDDSLTPVIDALDGLADNHPVTFTIGVLILLAAALTWIFL